VGPLYVAGFTVWFPLRWHLRRLSRLAITSARTATEDTNIKDRSPRDRSRRSTARDVSTQAQGSFTTRWGVDAERGSAPGLHVAATAIATLLVIAAVGTVVVDSMVTIVGHSALPLWDEWETAWNIRDAMTRGIGSVHWLARHGEHTIAVTRALAVLDGYLSRATNVTTLAAVWVLMLLLALETAVVAMPVTFTSRTARVGIVATVVLFMFQPRNLENLSWGFQNQFAAVFLFALLAIAASCHVLARAERGGDGSTVWTAVGGWIAACLSSVSMGNGFLAGPLCAIVAFLGKAPRWYRIGSVVTAVVCILPLLRPTGIGSETAAGSVAQTVVYLKGLLSSPFLIRGRPFAQVGALGLLVLVSAIGSLEMVRHPITTLRAHRMKIVCAAFLLATILAISVSRSNYGIESAYSGRYLVPVVAWWAVSLGLMVDVLATRFWWRRLSLVAIATAVAIGCASILVGARGEIRHFGRQGRDNRLAEAMIVTGVRDDRLIKRVGAWPDQLEEFLNFFESRRLGPFAYARAWWKGKAAGALFPNAAREDLSNQCRIDSVDLAFGDGGPQPLNQWTWRPSAERFGWFHLSGHCVLPSREDLSAELVVLQEKGEQVCGLGNVWSGLGNMWSTFVARGPADRSNGSFELVEFEAYAESTIAQRLTVAAIDRHRSRVRLLGSVAVDPDVGWRTAANSENLVGTVDTVTVNGRSQTPAECLSLAAATPVRLSGWALDLTKRKPVSAVIVVDESGKPVFTGYGYTRPDVAQAYHSEDANFVGWNVEVTLEPGKNRRQGLSVIALSADGREKKALSQSLLECAGEQAR
jgi:hypothetical protein